MYMFEKDIKEAQQALMCGNVNLFRVQKFYFTTRFND